MPPQVPQSPDLKLFARVATLIIGVEMRPGLVAFVGRSRLGLLVSDERNLYESYEVLSFPVVDSRRPRKL